MKGIVHLRAVADSDLPILFEHQRDPDAIAMAAFPPRDREAFDAHWKKIRADESIILRTIEFDAQVAGTIVSFDKSGLRHIGYWLGKAYWGQGIATRAVAELLKEDTTRPLCAHVAKTNAASLRVLQKFGFTIRGEETYFCAELGMEIEDWILELREHAPVRAN